MIVIYKFHYLPKKCFIGGLMKKWEIEKSISLPDIFIAIATLAALYYSVQAIKISREANAIAIDLQRPKIITYKLRVLLSCQGHFSANFGKFSTH